MTKALKIDKTIISATDVTLRSAPPVAAAVAAAALAMPRVDAAGELLVLLRELDVTMVAVLMTDVAELAKVL